MRCAYVLHRAVLLETEEIVSFSIVVATTPLIVSMFAKGMGSAHDRFWPKADTQDTLLMLKQIAFAAAAYAGCWITAHCVVMLSRGDGLSLEYLVSYFRLAWSFSGAELPSFIWTVSLALFLMALAIWFLASRRVARAG